MSYPGVDPSEIEEVKPAETQVISEGEPTEIHSPENETVEPPLSDEQLRLAAEKAAAEAIKHQFDVHNSWSPKKIVKFVIQCPEGQKALVKHLSTNELINHRLMEELDFFTKMLFSAGTEQSAGSIFASLDDPEKRLKFFDMTNRLITAASIKPKVINDGCALVSRAEYEAIISGEDIPKPSGDQVVIFGHEVKDITLQVKLFKQVVPEAKPGEAYAGTIEFGDRLAFYQELSKPLAVIEPFREGQDVMLASMETVPSPALSTEQSV